MSSGCCTSSDRKWRSARMYSFLHRHLALEIFLLFRLLAFFYHLQKLVNFLPEFLRKMFENLLTKLVLLIGQISREATHFQHLPHRRRRPPSVHQQEKKSSTTKRQKIRKTQSSFSNFNSFWRKKCHFFIVLFWEDGSFSSSWVEKIGKRVEEARYNNDTRPIFINVCF